MPALAGVLNTDTSVRDLMNDVTEGSAGVVDKLAEGAVTRVIVNGGADDERVSTVDTKILIVLGTRADVLIMMA